ncbi:hypothetical protein FPV67DRAFT_1447831 [Lyophyllum atratum]|nr:hypothetical protein FPV67DRAFT_1447831 [Lyophyllum atratum]
MYANPFGSWASGSQNNSNPPPSIYGALPYTGIATSDLITFYFTSFKPSILNCVVVGAQNEVHYRIESPDDVQGYSVITNSGGAKIALVEWRTPPLVELRGLVRKQPVNQWLKLTPNRSAREMDVRGMRYVWAPVDKSINLYAGPSSGTTFLAKLTRGPTYVTLEMTPDAVQLGLLDSVVIAALLLQCGRNID